MCRLFGQDLNLCRESWYTMDFVVSEPLYDVCESWAEEPSPEAWDLDCAALRDWLIRSN